MPKLMLIDGNSLVNRAYYGVRPLSAPDGTPTNACFGFVAMLLKFVEMAHPDAIVCAFDAGRPKWRMEAIEQYKAQRPPMDDALKVQFPLMEGLLEGWLGRRRHLGHRVRARRGARVPHAARVR